MYLFNIFNEPKDNNYITTILTWLDTNPPSFLHMYFRTVKTSSIPSNSLLYLRKYLVHHNKDYIFMIRKDWGFCNQSLQYMAILYRVLRISILSFFNFWFFFFPKYVPLSHGFPTIPDLLNSFKCSKSYNGPTN